MITELIDKFDNVEIIRDKIALILASEIANQKIIAIDEGKANPDEWNFKTFTERSNPIEDFLNINQNSTLSETLPVVNVWFDNYSIEDRSSNTVERQKINGIFNIDIYALGIAKNNQSGGHVSGDELANREVQRVFRLVRNILMSSGYTYLDLRGVVSKRWIQSVTAISPDIKTHSIQDVQVIRIAFNVEFNEFSPQYKGQETELITNEIKKNEDGSILANADYTYPII